MKKQKLQRQLSTLHRLSWLPHLQILLPSVSVVTCTRPMSVAAGIQTSMHQWPCLGGYHPPAYPFLRLIAAPCGLKFRGREGC